MPITMNCPQCPLGLLHGDRVQGAFECDMCGARLPEQRPPNPPIEATGFTRGACCPCHKCNPVSLGA